MEEVHHQEEVHCQVDTCFQAYQYHLGKVSQHQASWGQMEGKVGHRLPTCQVCRYPQVEEEVVVSVSFHCHPCWGHSLPTRPS